MVKVHARSPHDHHFKVGVSDGVSNSSMICSLLSSHKKALLSSGCNVNLLILLSEYLDITFYRSSDSSTPSHPLLASIQPLTGVVPDNNVDSGGVLPLIHVENSLHLAGTGVTTE